MGNWVLLPPPFPSSPPKALSSGRRGADINHGVVVVVVGVRLDGSETYTSSILFFPSVSLSISTSVGKKKAHGRGPFFPRKWEIKENVVTFTFSFTLPKFSFSSLLCLTMLCMY